MRKLLYIVNRHDPTAFPTLTAALEAVKTACDPAAFIHLCADVYREKVVIDVPGVTLEGEGMGCTRLVYGDSAHLTDSEGNPLGTFRTATLRLHADDITIRYLTVENDAGPGEVVEQAVALYIAGDRCAVEYCELLAHQDTLFAGPDQGAINEVTPCGRRAYLADCVIRGNVDFIFGSYAVWLERCVLWCITRHQAVNAMLCAPNTPEGQDFGFVFHRCRVVSDCEDGTVYLARPWRSFGKAAFLHCEFPPCIAPAGWLDWANPFRSVWAGLCESADAATPARHSGAHILTAAEEGAFTPEHVLSGDDGWSPYHSDNRRMTMNNFDTFAAKYLKAYTPFKDHWNYEDGCVLVGSVAMYKATGEAMYRDFVLDYMKRFVEPDGSIPCYETAQYNIDSINAGKALYFALDETGDERYRGAIEYHMQRLREHPRCECGNFWHKTIYPYQIWLDGLYMAQPFYMEYEKRFDGMAHLDDIVNQYKNVRKYLWCEEKGLYYHGYDESRAQPWANRETGCSKNFWLRSMGWFLMSMIDCIALMDEQLFDEYKAMTDQLREAVRGILPYRDAKSGLFYQVIDHPEEPKNYLETTGSLMIAYTLMKGSRLGVLNAEKYLPIGREIYEQVLAQKLVTKENGEIHLIDNCLVSGLGPGEKRDGTVAYYLSEPKGDDDNKGVGALFMANAEYQLTRGA